MKNILKYLTFVALFAAFSACNEDPIDSLTGKYPVPNEYTLTSLTSQSVVKHDNGTRTITLQFTSADAALNVDFVVNAHFLKENGYTLAPAATAKNGNYTSAAFAKTGAAQQQATAGVIYVKLSSENNYTVNATLQLADNSFVRVEFTGAIVFEADPPAMTYMLEVQKPYAWTADGMNYTPVVGSQLNKITVKSDGATVAYFEIVTEENPASFAGTYPVKAVNSLERAICQGQYLDLAWFGMAGIPPIESGSYLLDESKLFVRSGNITITDNNGTLSLASSDLAIQDIATQGQFGTLPTPASIDYKDATREKTFTYTKEVTAPYAYTMDGQTYINVDGSQLNKITVLADGTPCAVFEVVTEENTATLTGSYPVKAVNVLERAIVQGQYMNLLWLGMFDMGIESGSYYVENETKQFIREGTINITETNGSLSIVGSSLKLQDISTQMSFGVLPDNGSVNFVNVKAQ